MRAPSLVPKSFYARDAREVAPELIGKRLRRGRVVLKISEVEAYWGPEDSACHSRSGPTARNEAMFGPPGRVYVYLCYGLHFMLNIVTGHEGLGAAVLVRSAEPLEGLDLIQSRRGRTGLKPDLLSGPGKVGQALGLDLTCNHHQLYSRGDLELHFAAEEEAEVLVGRRVGIDYAEPQDRDALARFALAGSRWVTKRAQLSLRP